MRMINYSLNYSSYLVGLHFLAERASLTMAQSRLDGRPSLDYVQVAELCDDGSVSEPGLGLSRIKDYGDKAFGTWGSHYSLSEEVQRLKSLVNQPAGIQEALRGLILYLILRRERASKIPTCLSKPSAAWIYNCLKYLEAERAIRSPEGLVASSHPGTWLNYDRLCEIISDLVFESFIVEERSSSRYFKLTAKGAKYTLEVYLPCLAESPLWRRAIELIVEKTDCIAMNLSQPHKPVMETAVDYTGGCGVVSQQPIEVIV
ncbi:MAG: hypothetical protein QXJ75_00455 [Candidatus Bathyarchaeia archaeon]